MTGFSDLSLSLKARNVFEQIAAGVVNKLRPPERYGVVQSIDTGAKACLVLLNGDPAPVVVNYGRAKPSTTGLVVRVGGSSGDQRIIDVLNDFGPTSELGRIATLESSGLSSTVRQVGALQLYAGSTPPMGYIWADGSAVSRSAYPELFALLGTAYGSGDGSTTFNTPNPGNTPNALGWITITDFRNGWTQYAEAVYPAQYRMINGVVEFRGLVTRSSAPTTDTDMFYVPAWAAVASGITKKHYVVRSSTAGSYTGITAFPNGGFQYQHGATGFVSLDQISYTATPGPITRYIIAYTGSPAPVYDSGWKPHGGTLASGINIVSPIRYRIIGPMCYWQGQFWKSGSGWAANGANNTVITNLPEETRPISPAGGQLTFATDTAGKFSGRIADASNNLYVYSGHPGIWPSMGGGYLVQ